MKVSIILILCLLGCTQKKVQLDKKIIPGSVSITDSLLIYATWSNHIIVESMTQNKIIFNHLVNDTCYAKPILCGNNIIFPVSDSILISKDIITSKQNWSISLPGRLIDTHVSGGRIIANLKHEGIIGIDISNGTILFRLPYIYGKTCSLPDLSPYRMSLGKDAFYVCNWQCVGLTAFSNVNGKVIWSKTIHEATGNAKYINGMIFWGQNYFYEGGRVSLLDAKSGDVLYTESSLFEENFDPICYQNKIYYYTYDKKLREMDLARKSTKVVFVFSDLNDVSGNQMYLLNGDLYYVAKFNLYKLSLTNFNLSKVKSDMKGIHGVYETNHKLKIVL